MGKKTARKGLVSGDRVADLSYQVRNQGLHRLSDLDNRGVWTLFRLLPAPPPRFAKLSTRPHGPPARGASIDPVNTCRLFQAAVIIGNARARNLVSVGFSVSGDPGRASVSLQRSSGAWHAEASGDFARNRSGRSED